ncbi:MAG: GntR family transcriptional regulator [Firmicutes bacterium]|jgi:DNA-binding GntR family transcriptional regulator|nr:GntR family transcriptional regulator [Bacillota bacterium]MDH7495603.1 GntR family transcriptional regulator [Bacillota bacterium]
MDERIVSTSLVEQIRGILREDIVSLRLLPGARLAVDSLAERFGVSRTPVRDALNALVEEGLVMLAPRVGYYVVELSAQDVEEIADIREMIELYALRRAMRVMRPQDIELLLEETRAVRSLRGEERRRMFEQLDRKFHTEMIGAANNKRLRDLSARILALVDLMRNLNARVDEALDEHIAILEAMRKGDVSVAQRLLQEHLEGVRRAIISEMSRAKGEDPARSVASLG